MKRVVGVFLALAVLAAGGWLWWHNHQTPAPKSPWQTSVLAKGTLESTVSVSGTVRARQSATLRWQIQGVVGKVAVAAGDHVRRDQVLAVLRDDQWPQALLQARVSLLNAQKQLQDLRDAASLRYAQALQQLAQAKRQRDRAQNHYDWIVNWDDEDAQQEYKKWHNMVISIQHDLNDPRTPPQLQDALRAQLELAKRQEQIAKANLDGPSDLDLQEAEANLTLAKAQVEQAEREVARWKDGPPADQVSILEAQIAAAQATLDMARLTAPFGSVVTDAQVREGNVVAPGQVAFRLDDLGQLLVDVGLSELDVAQVEVGQQATLAFDALPGRTYHGIVSETALAGEAARGGGSVTFRATVRLTDADEAIRPGMTAAVSIRTAHLEDVLLLPLRAIRMRDGTPVVFVLRAGQPQPVKVRLGATSDEYAQLLDGDLHVGDQIVLNPPTEQINFFGGH